MRGIRNRIPDLGHLIADIGHPFCLGAVDEMQQQDKEWLESKIGFPIPDTGSRTPILLGGSSRLRKRLAADKRIANNMYKKKIKPGHRIADTGHRPQSTGHLFLLLVLFTILTVTTTLRAQGGIGNMPRTDLVMLSAVTRDSLADEVYNRILDLKHYAETHETDSASMLVAYNGASDKSSKWVRAVNAKNDTEMVRVSALLDKLQKTFASSTEVHKEFFAVFKDKDNPAGEKILYQINFPIKGRKHMVSFTFYPIGDLLMLGDIQ